MPHSDSAASATPSPGPQDTQTLIALLNNLMPLLLRFQAQAFGQPMVGTPMFGPQTFGPQTIAGPQTFGPSWTPAAAALMAPQPVIEHQAAVNLVGDITADALRTLSGFLETNAGRYPGLENCVPIVTQAAHSFAAHDYAQAFGLVWQAYRLITMLRAANPQLPPLRAAAAAAAAFTAPPTIVH
jgi:hypothetical protein